MPPNGEKEMIFQEFLAEQMKNKGLSVKRVAEATGISPKHIENLLHGNFERMPSAPYFRGYLLRLGKALEFDGEMWWGRIKKESEVPNSGPEDALPQNRFVRGERSRTFWIGAVFIIIIVFYIVLQFVRAFGGPSIQVSYPSASPFTTEVNTITLQGKVRNADVLYLSNGSASSSEEIMVAADGTWEKTVLLQNGPNAFELDAKKLLGGEVKVTEEIIYQAPAESASSTPTSTTSTYPAVHNPGQIPATGSYFN